MSWLIFASLVVVFTLGASDNDSIVFPEEENDGGVLNAQGPGQPAERLPIDIEGKCPPNMLLYPGDGSTSTWICDCKGGYLYFPLNNSCHEAYRQGPCPAENYVILPPGEVIPKCERNPCVKDGLVPYNNTCSEVKSNSGPCPAGRVLSINATTFQLECELVNIGGLHIIDAPANRCPNGSRRNALDNGHVYTVQPNEYQLGMIRLFESPM